ncbi:hypothetical protein ACHAXA_008517 [Cyclostephanos tholiformis]|uniref:Uncharacterized protein n=1 Tax=Cyclostephanos tholiformis TaxID=382380 RepID=A0ABD3RT81_9STRA
MTTTTTTTMTTSIDDDRLISLPSHLLWRSLLGSPAAWSGTSSRGLYVQDEDDDIDDDIDDGTTSIVIAIRRGNRRRIRRIATDAKRMRRVPCSLYDRVMADHVLPPNHRRSRRRRRRLGGGRGESPSRRRGSRDDDDYGADDYDDANHNNVASPSLFSSMGLLSYPRIVGLASSSSYSIAARGGTAVPGTGWTNVVDATIDDDGGGGGLVGISCMDLDRGRDGYSDGSTTTPPPSSSMPRYLLVGSAGYDRSIALYDISYYGSDMHLHHRCRRRRRRRHRTDFPSSNDDEEEDDDEDDYDDDDDRGRSSSSSSFAARDPSDIPQRRGRWHPSDVPSASSSVTHPDVCGSFVSASMSGEVLVWDARNFVPVYATYNRVHTANDVGGWKSSVANVRCTDVPRTPEGCPHGCALLAMGLDGSGGVVRLCDAFRGADATHELTTTTSGGDGGCGGINSVVWDPIHPFRLASGGDDGAVRLWDVRKSGNAACLGALDPDVDGTSSFGDDDYDNWASSFRPVFSMDASRRRPLGATSHAGPVAAVTFALDGDDLAPIVLRHVDGGDRGGRVVSMEVAAAIRPWRLAGDFYPPALPAKELADFPRSLHPGSRYGDKDAPVITLL